MTAEAPTGGTGSLSEAEYAQFHRDGFLICPPVFGAAEMGRIRHALDRVLATSGYSRDPTAHRHLDSPEVYDLVAQPPIVDRIASLIGPDLLLWHTRFFDKPPGDGPVPWHQDMAFWPLDPPICVSVWIAIDPADIGNGCLEVVPGSHRMQIPHVESTGTGRFAQKADPALFEAREAVAIELEPGGFLLFDRWLVHGSPANESNRRRLGLAARIVPTSVTIDFSRVKPQFPQLAAQIVRGSDREQRNRLAPTLRTAS
jgi:ectoine hydroxylase-related dioxygenase (phytanoyl-CoA dioxygenase family)